MKFNFLNSSALVFIILFMTSCSGVPNCDEDAKRFAERVMRNDFDGGTNLTYDYSDCQWIDGVKSMNIAIRFNGNFFRSNVYEISGVLKVDKGGNEYVSDIVMNSTAESYMESSDGYKALMSLGKLFNSVIDEPSGSSNGRTNNSYDVVSCNQCQGTGEELGGSGDSYYSGLCVKCNGSGTIYRSELGY